MTGIWEVSCPITGIHQALPRNCHLQILSFGPHQVNIQRSKHFLHLDDKCLTCHECLPRMLVHTRCLLAPLKCDTVISMLFLFSSSMHSVPLILHMFLVISSIDRHFGHHFYPCFYCLSHPFPWKQKVSRSRMSQV